MHDTSWPSKIRCEGRMPKYVYVTREGVVGFGCFNKALKKVARTVNKRVAFISISSSFSQPLQRKRMKLTKFLITARGSVFMAAVQHGRYPHGNI